MRPTATIFVTPLGQELMARIPAVPTGPVAGSALAAVTELKTGADTRRQIAHAAARVAEAPAPALLLLGGGHNVASSLTMFHAAIDACRKHGMVLCLEHRAELLDQLEPLLQFLLHEPGLKKALGSNTLHSRKGQAIAWDYVRASGDRGALQRFLPEVLAWNEIRHRDIPLAFVDPLGVGGASDEIREDVMFARTRARLGSDQRGVLLGGLAHATPIQAACLRAGLNAHSLVVFDETADDLQRLYDVGDEPTGQTSVAANSFQHNLHLPQYAVAAPKTESYRVGFEVHPFS